MVLSETRAGGRGLSLVLVIRGGLWLAECLGETASQANALNETSPRPIGSDRHRTRDGSPHSQPSSSERYVDCIVSFSGSQNSPFFQRCRMIVAIFRARVSLAISGLVPRLIQAW